MPILSVLTILVLLNTNEAFKQKWISIDQSMMASMFKNVF